MMEEMDNFWGEDYEFVFDCFRCGVCCARYRPQVIPWEIEHIARELGISAQEFISKFVGATTEEGTSILDNGEDKCPFLSWDKETWKANCTIYPFRPQACINWVANPSCPECRDGMYLINLGVV